MNVNTLKLLVLIFGAAAVVVIPTTKAGPEGDFFFYINADFAGPMNATSLSAQDADEVKTLGASGIAALPHGEKLIGLDEATILVLLGAPEIREVRAPTERWVYRLRTCTLNIDFFREVRSHKLQAVGFDVVDDEDSTVQQQNCAAEFSSWFMAKTVYR